MTIENILLDYNIKYETHGHKHCRPGWVNTPCPFCTGNPGYHLGFELSTGRACCWRCGWKPSHVALAKVIGIDIDAANVLLKQKRITTGIIHRKIPKQEKPFQLPSNVSKIEVPHIRYLQKRKFDPDKIQRFWGVLGTGPLSKLDNIDYRHRIVIPIVWDGEMVSFQARDYTDKSKVKYLACPQTREKINHKRILYGNQSKWRGIGICVEGVTDVWRLGFSAFATFGISFKTPQAMQIYKHFHRVIILFDNDEQAQKLAKKLSGILHIETVIESLDGTDPGDLDQNDARYLVRKFYKI